MWRGSSEPPRRPDPDVLHDLLLKACSRAAEAQRTARAAVARANELTCDLQARRRAAPPLPPPYDRE